MGLAPQASVPLGAGAKGDGQCPAEGREARAVVGGCGARREIITWGTKAGY